MRGEGLIGFRKCDRSDDWCGRSNGVRKKFLHLALALGLISSLFVGAIVPAAAAPDDPGELEIFFPWVPHNDTLGGVEGVTGSITVQNL
ncbi:hypothetical protein [Sphaerobacter thermophilus]|uniref:Uncharacterized protein n=1 Tax=Sphaerobacter thermophilus (strain ATCC 49802 / DSM 20745 / KCCM 41009 / NCIMB 13125 / S 6022) TaxID=479434 RepID=D1C577_SPHTD|nr:hypothetical protein [Sphaerobacter thermophilus]ACZ39394.1 hypothetical protein Sthe_1963 [Sphaerobacter thermophilus DSM 20745]